MAKARERNGLTQQDVANALGLSNGAIGLWETAMAYPTRENEARLAKLLGVSVAWIRTGKDGGETVYGLRRAKQIVAELRKEFASDRESNSSPYPRGYRTALKDVERRISAAMVEYEG